MRHDTTTLQIETFFIKLWFSCLSIKWIVSEKVSNFERLSKPIKHIIYPAIILPILKLFERFPLYLCECRTSLRKPQPPKMPKWKNQQRPTLELLCPLRPPQPRTPLLPLTHQLKLLPYNSHLYNLNQPNLSLRQILARCQLALMKMVSISLLVSLERVATSASELYRLLVAMQTSPVVSFSKESI